MLGDTGNSLVVTVSCKRGKKPRVSLGVMVGTLLFSATMLTACGSAVSPAVETVAPPPTPVTPPTSVEAIQSQMQKFEVAAFRSAISTLEGNYTNRNVLASNLQTLGSEVTRLNARLALDEVFENADEIKQTITDADKLVSRIDLADPTVTVDNREQVGVELETLKSSLSMALDNYGLSHAEVGVERIELATPTHEGYVGDTLDLTPAVYPTMVKDTQLTYASSDTAVVTVDENGSVILVGAGSAEITVTDTESGVKTSMTVTSKAVPVQAKPQTPASGTQQQQAPATQQKPAGGAQKPATPQKPAGTGEVYVPEVKEYDYEEHKKSWEDATGGAISGMDDMLDMSEEDLQSILDKYN